MSRIGFNLGYPTVADALEGGEDADFGAVVADSVDASLIVGDLGAFAEAEAFGGIATVSFASAVLDCAAAPGTFVALMPSLPGYYAVAAQFQGIIKTASGAMTQAPACKVGNNVNHDNWLAILAGSPFSSVAFAVGVRGYGAATGLGSNRGPAEDLSTPPSMEITTSGAGTGGFVLTGRIYTRVSLARIADF